MKLFSARGSASIFLLSLCLSAVSEPLLSEGSGHRADEPASGLFPAGRVSEFSLVERSDYSLFIGDKYRGHIYRESRGILNLEDEGYSGGCYVLEESIHDAKLESRKVSDASILSFAKISGKIPSPAEEEEAARRAVAEGRKVPPVLSPGAGFVPAGQDSVFPSYRGLLSGMPSDSGALAAGLHWNSRGSFIVDPRDMDRKGGAAVGSPEAGSGTDGDLQTAAVIAVPFYADYKVMGETQWQGRKLRTIACSFILRYRSLPVSGASLPVSRVYYIDGKHQLVLNIDALSGELVFIRDSFEDEYRYGSAPNERHRGFTLVFLNRAGGQSGMASTQSGAVPNTAPEGKPADGEEWPAEQTAHGIPAESQDLDRAGVEVVHTGHNYVLLLKELPFAADSAELIPGEEWRLDTIAAELRALPAQMSFLVEGHSASTGRPAGELELSEQRAKRIVDALSARGIAASRFIYRGCGSAVPLAPNNSEAGRARNRRVEITILDF